MESKKLSGSKHCTTCVALLLLRYTVSHFRITVKSEIITFLIQKHFKTITVTVILGKLIQMTFKTVIGNQWNEGVTADAKTVTVMVTKLIHPNFKTVTVTVIWGK